MPRVNNCFTCKQASCPLIAARCDGVHPWGVLSEWSAPCQSSQCKHFKEISNIILQEKHHTIRKKASLKELGAMVTSKWGLLFLVETYKNCVDRSLWGFVSFLFFWLIFINLIISTLCSMNYNDNLKNYWRIANSAPFLSLIRK